MRKFLCFITLFLLIPLIYGCSSMRATQPSDTQPTTGATSESIFIPTPTPPNRGTTTEPTEQSTESYNSAKDEHLSVLLTQDPNATVYASFIGDINEDGTEDSIILYYDSPANEKATSAGVSVFIGGYSCAAIGLGNSNELVFSSEPVFCCHHGIASVFVFCNNQSTSDASPIYFQIDYTYDSADKGSNFKITSTP